MISCSCRVVFLAGLLIVSCNQRNNLEFKSISKTKNNLVEVFSILDQIDRNLKIYFNKEMIFRTPDEAPKNEESIIWSKDENCFILLGNSFYVIEESLKINELDCYFLYDSTKRKIYCNALQYQGERITEKVLKELKFLQLNEYKKIEKIDTLIKEQNINKLVEEIKNNHLP